MSSSYGYRRRPGVYGGANDAPVQVGNRRWAERKSSGAAALIRHAELPIPLPCVVCDISATGAKLQLKPSPAHAGAPMRLPPKFRLVVRADGIEADCTVAWRNGSHMGVRFVSPLRQIAKPAR
jgi:hypothetical protein